LLACISVIQFVFYFFMQGASPPRFRLLLCMCVLL